MKIAAAPAETRGGRVLRLYGTVKDVTEERAQELHFKRLSEVAARTNNIVIIVDTQSRITWVNPAFTRVTGWRLDEVQGKTPKPILHSSATSHDTERAIAAAMNAQKGITCELMHRDRWGREFLSALDVQPFYDELGNHAGFVSIQSDLSERIAHEERLNAVEQEARDARAQLTAAIETLPDAFVLYDAEERLQLCNSRFREYLPECASIARPGVTFEELVRHGLENGQYADLPEDREAWLAERLEMHRGDGAMIEQKLSDGRWLRIDQRRTPDGGRVGIQVDITELKRQEAALRASNADLRAALDERDATERRFSDIAAVSNDWFWELDAAQCFRFLSSPPAGVGDPFAAMASGRLTCNGVEDAADSRWLEKRMAARDRFDDFVYRQPKADGEERWFRLSGAPFHDGHGTFCGYRGVGSDITRLYQALVRAEEASRAKSAFLATMSHEIRTPLNGVIGMTDELEAVIADPEQKQLVETIRESGALLLQIINDVLDFSKIEAGKLTLESVNFRVQDLAGKLSDFYATAAADKGLSFDVTPSGAIDTVLAGDTTRILQILHNLVSNAMKFTSHGGITVALDVQQNGRLEIRVRDTGIGMSLQQLGRVFENFSQADSSTTRKFGGTGLGMSIVQKIVVAMQGAIEMESWPDRGTEVRLTLPLAVSDGDAAPAEEDLAEDTPLDDVHVLVADDNATNRRVLDLLLKRLGVAATIVNGGPEAIEAARAGSFDLLLLDISMPEIDGLEALRAIREEEAAAGRAATPAIAVSANALDHQVAEYLGQGFAGHLPKPIKKAGLADAIRRCLAA